MVVVVVTTTVVVVTTVVVATAVVVTIAVVLAIALAFDGSVGACSAGPALVAPVPSAFMFEPASPLAMVVLPCTAVCVDPGSAAAAASL